MQRFRRMCRGGIVKSAEQITVATGPIATIARATAIAPPLMYVGAGHRCCAVRMAVQRRRCRLPRRAGVVSLKLSRGGGRVARAHNATNQSVRSARTESAKCVGPRRQPTPSHAPSRREPRAGPLHGRCSPSLAKGTTARVRLRRIVMAAAQSLVIQGTATSTRTPVTE